MKRSVSERKQKERLLILIELKHLTKVFGDRVAVNDLSIKLPNGAVYGLLGPHGAGASTLLALLAGAVPPSEGDAKINGFSVVSSPKKAKARIGYLPEDCELYGTLTPQEILSFVAEVREPSPERGQRQVLDALEQLELEEVKNRPLQRLSLAQRRRVGIAQTLIGNTEILLLDAPFQGLAPKEIALLSERIRELASTRTVILSSHRAAELEGLCDRVLFLSDGCFKESAPEEEPSPSPYAVSSDEPEYDGEYELIDTETKGDL